MKLPLFGAAERAAQLISPNQVNSCLAGPVPLGDLLALI